uniref:Uncharacterized protein n=1 Tax=Caenorhabditis japonica TaxID=281687 RepID=A0A8R1ISB3_CAEJA
MLTNLDKPFFKQLIVSSDSLYPVSAKILDRSKAFNPSMLDERNKFDMEITNLSGNRHFIVEDGAFKTI